MTILHSHNLTKKAAVSVRKRCNVYPKKGICAQEVFVNEFELVTR